MRLNKMLALAGAAVALGLSSGQLVAQDNQGNRPRGQGQGRGNFDPEEMRQRLAERIREQLDVKSDDEWKIIYERVEKVNQARREVGAGGGFGAFGFGRGGRGGPGGGGGDASAGGDQNRRRGFGGERSPEAEALQKAIEAQASSEEIKAKLAKYREARKEKEAKLEQAQEELRKVLTVKQEAAAVLAGLLK